MVVSAEAQDPPAQRFDALQFGLIAILIGLAAPAWALTVGNTRGMDMGPGSDLGSLSFYVGAWVLMVVAMMFPSIAPAVRTYALIERGRPARRGLGEPSAEVVAFVAGYLLTSLKGSCLNRCRGPLDFLTERRRDGVGGALRLGLEHGVWCAPVNRGIAVLLVVLGLSVALVPERVPGLALPDSSSAMQAMGRI